MNKLFLKAFFFLSIALVSCGDSRDNSDAQDSINAARAADSLIQNQLNADTSMNTDSTIDNMPADSMPKGSDTR